MDDFLQAIAKFQEVTVAHTEQTIADKQTATYFLGRATCPYCRIFVEKLTHVVEATGQKVYFINSERLDQLEQLSEFRYQYGIATVPAFIRVSAGQLQLRCDSSMSEADIQAFMQL